MTAIDQAYNITPPRNGECAALNVNGTAASWGIENTDFGGETREPGHRLSRHVFLTLQAINADIEIHFSANSGATLNTLYAQSAAGGTVALSNQAGATVKSGFSIDVWIDRNRDRYLAVQAAAGGAGVLRIWPASDPDR